MKRDDIKPGMNLHFNNGKTVMTVSKWVGGFLSEALLLTNIGSHVTAILSGIVDENLNVPIPDVDLQLDYITSENDEILWKRPEEIVVTMEEIAEKFDCNVEQIRIKA
jgi:hypothetical protein